MADITTLYVNRIAVWAFLLLAVIPLSTSPWRYRNIASRYQNNTNKSWPLVFDGDLGKTVLHVKGNRTTNVSIIFKAAKILRHGYFHLQQEFTTSTISESNSIPPILKTFLQMLLYGSGIDQPPPGQDKSIYRVPVLDNRLYSTLLWLGINHFFLWPRSSNGNSLKQNLVKILPWSYLVQSIQKQKEVSRPLQSPAPSAWQKLVTFIHPCTLTFCFTVIVYLFSTVCHVGLYYRY